MKLRTTVAIVIMGLAIAVAGGQGKMSSHKMPVAKPMSKSDWQAMYRMAERDFDAKNADAIFKYMTSDFKVTMNGKAQNAAQAKAGMRTWFAMMKNVHMTMTVTNVSGNANEATVVNSFNNSGMTMPDPKTHKSVKFTDVGVETATWVKKNGKWMMRSLTTNKEKMTMDGKPFNPPGM